MSGGVKALKGQICYSTDKDTIMTKPNSYLVYKDNGIIGVFEDLPKDYKNIHVEDYGEQVIIPGLVDLHTHAPQYSFRGLAMDEELIDWLNTYTFPEEGKYKDLAYAEAAYRIFVKKLKKGATTRAVIFGTRHVEATLLLMDLIEESGINAMVGKVNMDRNGPDYLIEESVEKAVQETTDWLESVKGRYQHVQPILTPRFTPSCSDELMDQLQIIQKNYNLPVQSHLSENMGEIQWVKELCPWSSFYGQAYDRFGLFGNETRTVMAHCVYSSEEEVQLMKDNGVFIAHCPESNANLSSGIAPVRQYLNLGMHVGLGTDVAGGSSDSLFKEIAFAIQVSKLRWRTVDQNLAPLTTQEAFYLATKGGGQFFGKVGSFEKGYELDAVVIDDRSLLGPRKETLFERLERIIYLSENKHISAKYVAGRLI